MRPDHAVALVELGLEMRDAIAQRRFGGRKLAIRIGINSGPVVAGVIGRKKFSYDLWGASVNLASRMQSQGQSQTVQITRSTYDLVKDVFECESRGMINVRGAGQMEVWHVVSPKPVEFFSSRHVGSRGIGNAATMAFAPTPEA